MTIKHLTQTHAYTRTNTYTQAKTTTPLQHLRAQLSGWLNVGVYHNPPDRLR